MENEVKALLVVCIGAPLLVFWFYLVFIYPLIETMKEERMGRRSSDKRKK